jgi:hypothetical protein
VEPDYLPDLEVFVFSHVFILNVYTPPHGGVVGGDFPPYGVCGGASPWLGVWGPAGVRGKDPEGKISL